MAKIKSVFTCSECGYESGKWMGKCPNCDNWNTFIEGQKNPSKAHITTEVSSAKKLKSINIETNSRLMTNMGEFDRVLGGGLVSGSVTLISGDPGIGKSTLLMQICANVSLNNLVLYVSGEESESQIKLRVDRLNVEYNNIFLLCETDVEQIERHILDLKPAVVVIDSIQTMIRHSLTTAQGSVTQVREATLSFTNIAKKIGASMFIVGHVTRVGSIAGPMVLEHIVDTVLFFEGDRYDNIRVLRAMKNRFGSTNELSVFEMEQEGLKEVENPSELFLNSRTETPPGCALLCTVEGSRALLAEVQALVCKTAFGMPRRMATGVDYNRMSLLTAVLEKRLGAKLFDQDIFVNIVGGLKIDERAIDIAVLASIASSYFDKPVQPNTVAIGEVGLTGEIRGVNNISKRIAECSKLGFNRIVLPKTNLKNIKNDQVELIEINTANEALKYLIK